MSNYVLGSCGPAIAEMTKQRLYKCVRLVMQVKYKMPAQHSTAEHMLATSG